MPAMPSREYSLFSFYSSSWNLASIVNWFSNYLSFCGEFFALADSRLDFTGDLFFYLEGVSFCDDAFESSWVFMR